MTARTALQRLAASLLLLLASCATTPAETAWLDLFDGNSLTGWETTQFGGEGEITIEHGAMHFDMGSPMTGVTLTATPPSGEYELEVTAARIDGTDFFCGVTFPVGSDYLSLILGGWGGSVCGLSNLNGNDASRNETRTLKGFESGRDYTATIRVTAAHIEVLLDGQPFLASERSGKELSLRPEVTLCAPLGIASFNTLARVKTVRWRPLLRRP